MKATISCLALCAALGVLASSAPAQPRMPKAPRLRPMGPSVAFQASGADVDDYLLDLGRAADVNIFADATSLAPPKPMAPYLSGAQHGPMPMLLERLARAQNLTYSRRDAKTLLLWDAPDIPALANRIIAGETITMLTVEAPPASASTPNPGPTGFALPRAAGLRPSPFLGMAQTDPEMATLWKSYLRERFGWDGETPGFSRTIPVADLPPDLRARVLAKTQAYLLNPGLMAQWKAYLSDEFWQTARLQFRSMEQGGLPGVRKQTLQVLFISGVVNEGNGRRGHSMWSIGLRPLPPNSATLPLFDPKKTQPPARPASPSSNVAPSNNTATFPR